MTAKALGRGEKWLIDAGKAEMVPPLITMMVESQLPEVCKIATSDVTSKWELI